MNENQIQNKFYQDQAQRFDWVYPNMTPPSWFENDLLAVTKAGVWNEFEIKLSKSDFLADNRKAMRVRYEHHGPPWSGHRPRKYGGEYGNRAHYWPRRYYYSDHTKYELLDSGFDQGPNRFWYIVPENLLTPEDIPSFAGLMYFKPQGRGRLSRWETVVEAPRLHQKKICDMIIHKANGRLTYRYWDQRFLIERLSK